MKICILLTALLALVKTVNAQSFFPLFFTHELRSPDYHNQQRSFPEKLISFKNMMAYPNPASEIITVMFDHSGSDYVTFELIDMIGNPLKTWTEPIESFSFKKEFSLADISNGIYFIRVTDGNQTFVKKIIVEK